MCLILVEARGCQVPWNWGYSCSYPPCCLPNLRAQGLSMRKKKMAKKPNQTKPNQTKPNQTMVTSNLQLNMDVAMLS